MKMKRLSTVLLTIVALVLSFFPGTSYAARTPRPLVIATFTGIPDRTVSFTVPAGLTWYLKWSGSVGDIAISHLPDPKDISGQQALNFGLAFEHGPNPQPMRQGAGWGRFWMDILRDSGSRSPWKVEITGSGTPLPPTGLPALHQPITVTPLDQPGVTYKVSLDQAWPDLVWKSGSWVGDDAVQLRFTMTTTSNTPLTSETPADDPTLVLTNPDGAMWEGKPVMDAAPYQCPAELPVSISLLNPSRTLTGCVVYNVPPRFAFAIQSPSTRVVWQPDGLINADQKSYAWQPWPA